MSTALDNVAELLKELVAKNKEIAALEDRIRFLQDESGDYKRLAELATRHERGARAAHNRVRRALLEYGHHHPYCYRSVPRLDDGDAEPCSCGFAVVLAREKGEANDGSD